VTAPTEAPPRPQGDSPPAGRRATAWTAAGVAVVLAVVLMWIWIFSGAAKKTNPDWVTDRDWAEQAEDTCAATQQVVDERAAPAGRQSAAERADAIDESTEDLAAMIAALRDPLPDSAADREVVEPWLADWEKLLDDRRTYADAVRANPDAQFYTEEKFSDGLDSVIETFANVNEIFSCAPAGDVG
jgi:hypothetical protein